MTSINTNASAMVALETLRGINTNLNTLNDQISTGKRINTAKDNASIWSIAKTMDSDVMSFEAVTDSLSLAASTIGVARTGAESITDLLIEVKTLITQSSNKSSEDRSKITTDIADLRNQIQDIVEAAQFNGVNLLNETQSVSYLSSFNRDNTGNVSSDTISVDRQDLRVGTGGAVAVTNGDATQAEANRTAVVGLTVTNGSVTAAGEDATFTAIEISSLNELSEGDNIVVDLGAQSVNYTVSAADASASNTAASVIDNIITQVSGAAPTNVTFTRQTDGGTESLVVTASTTITNGDASSSPSGITGVAFQTAQIDDGNTGTAVTIAATNDLTEGDNLIVTVAGQALEYTVTADDAAATNTAERVINGLINSAAAAFTNANVTANNNAGTWELQVEASGANITPSGGAADDAVTVNGTLTVANAATDAGSRAYAGVSGGGGLEALFNIFVDTETETQAALTSVETLINTAKDASAALGSSERRIEIQSEFVTNLVDSLELGISALTDADLSAASAELSALQVQQQLGLQSLAIANQGPQTILALFR